MDSVTGIAQAMGRLAFPVFLLFGTAAALLGPVYLTRFAADRLAAARRKLADRRGGSLVVKEDPGRLSPAVVPSGRPPSSDRRFDPIFTVLRYASVFAGVGGLLTAHYFPGSILPFAALLAGFPGFLVLLAFEQRYQDKVRSPRGSPDQPHRSD